MSSILKALKKIEGASPPLQTYPSSTKPIDPEQALNSNTRKRRRFRRIFYLFLILILITIATAILFNQRRLIIASIKSVVSSETPPAGEASNSSGTNVYRKKIPTRSEKPDQKSPTVTRQATTQTKKTVPDSSGKRYQARTSSNNRRQISSKPPSQTSADQREPKAVLDSAIKKPLNKTSPLPVSKPANKKRNVKKDTSTIAPVTRDRKPAQSRPRETYDQLDDSKLKLQALAWSDDADRRMVVVNGRIVHEGESVDGYQVIKIREEDVVVKGGGKSWRLVFGLQQ